MTSLIERILATVAPHQCLVCSEEGNILCVNCLPHIPQPLMLTCLHCQRQTTESAICQSCQKLFGVRAVWFAADFRDELARAIKLFKFERARAGAKPLATLVASRLPWLDPATLIIPIPTASTRIRARGYDQTRLLAQELGKLTGLSWAQLLERVNQDRQVGAGRATRWQQAQRAFRLRDASEAVGKKFLIIDDVATTGSTLLSAAALLHKAGAATVDVAAVARQQTDARVL